MVHPSFTLLYKQTIFHKISNTIKWLSISLHQSIVNKRQQISTILYISIDQSIVNKRKQTRTILYISKHRILNEGGDSIDG